MSKFQWFDRTPVTCQLGAYTTVLHCTISCLMVLILNTQHCLLVGTGCFNRAFFLLQAIRYHPYQLLHQPLCHPFWDHPPNSQLDLTSSVVQKSSKSICRLHLVKDIITICPITWPPWHSLTKKVTCETGKQY